MKKLKNSKLFMKLKKKYIYYSIFKKHNCINSDYFKLINKEWFDKFK